MRTRSRGAYASAELSQDFYKQNGGGGGVTQYINDQSAGSVHWGGVGQYINNIKIFLKSGIKDKA
jgi:hypothetical protein